VLVLIKYFAFFSNDTEILPPRLSVTTLTITEGADAAVDCYNDNNPLVSDSQPVWVNSEGAAISLYPFLPLRKVTMVQSGIFKCVVMSADGKRVTTTLTVTITVKRKYLR